MNALIGWGVCIIAVVWIGSKIWGAYEASLNTKWMRTRNKTAKLENERAQEEIIRARTQNAILQANSNFPQGK